MNFYIKGSDFYLNDKKIKIISGAVHYFRNMSDTWRDIFKKLRALGCNCVETYCAWNMHEKRPGEFDFSGMLDISRFLTLAQQEGLLAIVRPGPYICAEWEFGGLPWWIQTYDDMEIRCSSPVYMKYFKRYIKNIADIIAPLQITRGGNVIMVQCENEYGYYGDDKNYLKELRDYYVSSGIEVPLFTSDGTGEDNLLVGTVEGCLATLNFGSRVKENFAAHDQLFPDSPKMCMEMWNGWFDAWGDEKHHTTSAEDYAKALDDMLSKGSVNMYMFIGGTNFGFTSGANHYEKFAPDVTSYDYDALLTESGDITPKYLAVREVIQRHTGAELPDIPPARKKKAFGRVEFTESALLTDNLGALSSPHFSNVPGCMESYGVGYGYIAYETTLNRDYKDSTLWFESLGDRAQVYVNDALCGIVYVNDDKPEVKFSASAGDKLFILVENMGRANFGSKMMRKKGIAGRCLIDSKIHFNWTVYPLPMDNLDKLCFKPAKPGRAMAFYRGTFTADEPADTFLSTEGFTKGFVLVNGFNIGRYWKAGPQKRLFVPASVIKPGKNQVVLFESDALPDDAAVTFMSQPDLG